jgi:hypothetical protein
LGHVEKVMASILRLEAEWQLRFLAREELYQL